MALRTPEPYFLWQVSPFCASVAARARGARARRGMVKRMVSWMLVEMKVCFLVVKNVVFFVVLFGSLGRTGGKIGCGGLDAWSYV